MNTILLVFALLYNFAILGLCTFLLVRGITHAFVCSFAVASLIELIRALLFLYVGTAPGGFNAHEVYLPVIAVFGFLGMSAFAAGFVLLTKYLLRAPATLA